MSILNLIRPELLNSPNYIPGGKMAQSRLHANELPWSPLTSESDYLLNTYPKDSLRIELENRLAARYQVLPEQLVITRGSDEGIDLLVRLFITAGQDAFMQFPPTFPMYAFYVRLQQGELIQSPLQESTGFSLSLEQMQQAWQPNCKIIMICSPNNPTANGFPLDFIASVCETFANRSVIVVDEAYIEFAEGQSATTLISRYENIVVLRTLSKAYGLAGLRVGSIIAQESLINAIKKIIAPYTFSSPVISMASQALNDTQWLTQSIKKILQSRQWLATQLSTLACIDKVYPSETNFLLIKSPYARQLNSYCATQGIALRDFPSASPLHQHLRISVGNETQNQQLINALSSFSRSEPRPLGSGTVPLADARIGL